jgi:hypothetical protein
MTAIKKTLISYVKNTIFQFFKCMSKTTHNISTNIHDSSEL